MTNVSTATTWTLCLLGMISQAVADEPPTPPTSPQPQVQPGRQTSPDDQAQTDLLLKGANELRAGRRQEALALIDHVIAHYEKANAGAKVDLFCARDAVEALLYMTRAVDQKRAAKIVSRNWADAYLIRGYVLIDLGQLQEARKALEAAVALSPFNAQYLSELGYVYQASRDWPRSLESYRKSAEGAEAISPPDQKNKDIARALRGQGFALTELGQLDEAEGLYLKSMELDATDTKAANELRYIQQLRDKQAHAKPGP